MNILLFLLLYVASKRYARFVNDERKRKIQVIFRDEYRKVSVLKPKINKKQTDPTYESKYG